MRNCLVIAALAGSIFSTASALPTPANAMTPGMPAGLSNAITGVNQPEPVRWCHWRGCWGGPYWGPRPYWGYYRPYGFYRPWGWARRHRW